MVFIVLGVSFIKNKSRIAKKKFFLEISEVESFDIDTEIDFKIAEEIAKKLKKLLCNSL